MRILITGDVSTWNISNFKTENINEKYRNKISDVDLVIYNLEGPILKTREETQGIQFRENRILNFIILFLAKLLGKNQPRVSSDINIMNLLRLNKTLVTRANNHIKDFGKRGVIETQRILEENNIKHVGAEYSSLKPKSFERVASDVVVLNFNLVGNKYGFSLYNSSRKSFGSSGMTLDEIKKEVEKYKEDKVLLILHYGKEMKDNAEEIRIDFEKVKDIGVELTVIHHPHIYIKTEYEKDNIFILGDFIFYRPEKFDLDRGTAILQIQLEGEEFNTDLIKCKVSDIYNY